MSGFRTKPSPSAVAMILGSFVFSCSLAITFSQFLIRPNDRGEVFAFTLVLLCFLEFLVFSYLLFSAPTEGVPKHLGKFYKTIGILITAYTLISLATIVDYYLSSLLFHTARRYLNALAIESVSFLILSGFALILNAQSLIKEA